MFDLTNKYFTLTHHPTDNQPVEVYVFRCLHRRYEFARQIEAAYVEKGYQSITFPGRFVIVDPNNVALIGELMEKEGKLPSTSEQPPATLTFEGPLEGRVWVEGPAVIDFGLI